MNLPSIWFGFSFLFLIGLVYWALHLRNSWQHKQSIHLLMTVLVTLKVLTMAVDGLKLGVMRDTGEGSGWDYIWYFLYAVKGGTLFIVIVLIGSGWSFVKPFLSERDKRIVMVILPLQVINNIGARRKPPASPPSCPRCRNTAPEALCLSPEEQLRSEAHTQRAESDECGGSSNAQRWW